MARLVPSRLAILAAIALGAGVAEAGARDHLGKISGANKHLDAAVMSLREAPEDFGGHKARAVALIGQAQDELKQAIAWAQKN